MVTDLLGSLLQELAQTLGIPPLKPDANNVCLVKFKGGIEVQIEMDRSGDFFLITTDLGSLPVGRYRENLFFEALKANGAPPPRHGVFAYSKQADRLILFEMLPLKELTGARIADALPLFLEKTKQWKEAISKNEMPPPPVLGGGIAQKGIFGLRP